MTEKQLSGVLDHAFTIVVNSKTDLERLGINLRMVDPSIYWEVLSAYEIGPRLEAGGIAFALATQHNIYYYLVVWPNQPTQ